MLIYEDFFTLSDEFYSVQENKNKRFSLSLSMAEAMRLTWNTEFLNLIQSVDNLNNFLNGKIEVPFHGVFLKVQGGE